MSRQVLVLGLLSMLMVGGSCGSSCVNFDGQTVRIHHDEAKDRLDALFLYRGLHSSESDTAQAIKQLEMIHGGARWFAFFSNWPFMLYIDSLVENEKEAGRPAANHLLDLLDANVEVRNGELWVDDEGLLSAWQLVRLRGLAEVLDAANAAQAEQARMALSQEDGQDLAPVDDAESVALLRAALERGDDFWTVDGQALVFSMPASDKGWETIKRELLNGLRDKLDVHGKDQAARKSNGLIEFLAINEWSIEREAGRVIFVLGLRHADELRLETPTVGLEGTDIVGELRDRGWSIANEGNDGAAHRAYEAFLREN